MIMNTLELNVLATNYLYEQSLNKLESIGNDLGNLVGKKIALLNGGLSKKFTLSSILEDEKRTIGGREIFFSTKAIYRVKRRNLLVLSVKICVNGGGVDENNYFCIYKENDIVIGEINDDGVLDNIEDLELSLNGLKEKTSEKLTYSRVKKQLDAYSEKQKELRELKYKIDINLRDFLSR